MQYQEQSMHEEMLYWQLFMSSSQLIEIKGETVHSLMVILSNYLISAPVFHIWKESALEDVQW